MKSTIVSCITLEDVFRDNSIANCDFLKLDCEGAEGEIIINTPRELFLKIKTITLEWHGDLNSISLENLTEFLQHNDYVVDYELKTGTIYAKRK